MVTLVSVFYNIASALQRKCFLYFVVPHDFCFSENITCKIGWNLGQNNLHAFVSIPLLVDNLMLKWLQFFFHCWITIWWWVNAKGVRRGVEKRAFPPLEIGAKNQNFFLNLKWAAIFRVLHLIVAMTVYLPVYHTDNHTAQESGSLFWCHAMMRLQFARALSFACRGRLRTLLADCSTVRLYCVTITRQ